MFKFGDLYRFAPDLLSIVFKIVKYSSDGFDRREKQELAEDLLALSITILSEVEAEIKQESAKQKPIPATQKPATIKCTKHLDCDGKWSDCELSIVPEGQNPIEQ